MVSGSAGIEESTVINKRPEPPQRSFYFNGTNDAGQLGWKSSVMKERAAAWRWVFMGTISPGPAHRS